MKYSCTLEEVVISFEIVRLTIEFCSVQIFCNLLLSISIGCSLKYRYPVGNSLCCCLEIWSAQKLISPSHSEIPFFHCKNRKPVETFLAYLFSVTHTLFVIITVL